MELAQEEEKAKDGWNWSQKGSCIFGSNGAVSSEKIAGFDMDWTLIRTKTGATFPKNADDWIIWDSMVPKKLQDLVKDKYKIVIFSNQGGIGIGKQNEGDIKRKIQNLSKAFGVPLQAYMSTVEDEYKKPRQGMWELLEKEGNDGVKIDRNQSFYCGDAAGRVPPEVPKKDFSDSDLKFALGLGVKFETPDSLFLNKKVNTLPAKGGFNPAAFIKNKNLFKEKDAVLKLEEQEMIVFCGSSSSGKSTFCVNNLSDYERINRDTLKTQEKCLKVAEEAILKKKSVVIDNTNPKASDRLKYIELAKKHGIPVRCFFFECQKDQCFFLNEQRVINNGRQHLSGKVPKIPIHSFFKNHEKPNLSEGFKSIQTVQFIPGPFKNEEDEKMFFIYGK
ncbi:P-loop containing nucleoside triphosphate hydrolase [Pseudocohnilembus persalinus]|uniref:p-loop containing nucleoside triphosphate hydrolase n=1 Tax=Pseudocohnilembus persalinus TaxID=266149 RepID=A0A0V0R078_PSEPJ|nr:P-loop containing nucleoside triphosphate hydrolase [Pseudocohnilembus persalinus]|eukprot:KRX07873.1 P-loop containing nucleoside triphosphate hydrolase [Pseudocohnilembus persalinus]